MKTYFRDIVEITLMPSLKNNFQVINACCQAGYPINPFLSWNESL